MPDVLLVTCRDLPAGEPGAAALDVTLKERGIEAAWVAWDDAAVDWAAADLVAVRSTWDYTERPEEFLAWARDVERATPILNGSGVFAWNVDKAYLTRLGDLPVVPTLLVDDVAAAVTAFGTAVLKPRVGAGGRGVLIADRADGDPVVVPTLAQPLVESIRTLGEVSVFVIDGAVVSAVRKVPAAGEIRAHEERGATVTIHSVDEAQHALARQAWQAAGSLTGEPLDYARIDMLHHDGAWVVSEIEATEPGLYLDAMPGNAEPYVDLVAARLGR
ncbi:ATP-grasp domain-containing protein [Nocardioides limicola]|uniref:ATP-grasp domain-containing protein n=1 Tax=Nocardioides limicola TaxID=2803368 RepID=UPI00193C2043|nr:hypothetical protein [Nocardioides sp. DJM-14]